MREYTRFHDYEDAANRAGLAMLGREEAVVQAALKQALNDVRAVMVRVYEQYADKGVLTYAQMTRYNRMAKLEAELLEVLNPALKTSRKVMARVPAEAYEESFFRYAWAMDNGSGVRLNYGTLSMETVRANLDNPMDWISGEDWTTEARMLMRRSLVRGLPVGKSLTDMARELKKAMETTAYRALRIIRTEGMTALNAGQAESYARAEKAGIEGYYVWDATLDARTRPEHGAKDGEKRAEDGLFDPLDGVRPEYPGDGNLSAAMRINCRCRLRYEVEGYAPLLRRTREDGLVPYQTYPQWLEGQEGTGPKIRLKI